MRIALDTNRYADLVAALPDAVDVIETADEVFLPFPVLAELHKGFRGGTRRRENEDLLSGFIRTHGVAVIYADEHTVSVWADLANDVKTRGRTLPHNDLWIAALCVQHGLRLYTRDRHFDHLPQVARV